MKKYRHKEFGDIVEAELFKPGMEDGMYQDKPYVVCTVGELSRILVDENDYVLLFFKNHRVYKSLLPKRDFEEKFEEV